LIPVEKRALIEQYLTPWDEQLNDAEDTESCFGQKIISEFLIQGINNLVSRARYAEDNLEKAVQQGVTQYVILGAGLDTFAFRQPEMLEKLEVFEVDHPATQEFKLHRLAELGWKQPAKLHFIPVVDSFLETMPSVLMRNPNNNLYDDNITISAILNFVKQNGKCLNFVDKMENN
jgi:methyltransferase (TIGR00027 family)